ncbi:hypothetical protein DM860_010162 [Cuscuta australis]|uniref:Peptidase S8/S53 domain-containing protein n=1 Tax=Cuscuta australis TaxID=267555 RepID=A0A328DA92_9ASTE|nr:hypothetical protein DM860_010162 [Cuscuta australis]
MKEEDMVYGIKAAIQKNVSMISMSLAQSLSFMCDWSSGDFHVKNIASLQALRADIVTVVSAGNLGKYYLNYVAKVALWCLTIASCTSKSEFMSTLTFKSDSARTNSFEIW